MIRGLILLTACLGTPVLAADLMDVYRLAEQNDTQLAAARADYLAMQERVPQARAGRYPDAGVRAPRVGLGTTGRYYSAHTNPLPYDAAGAIRPQFAPLALPQ